jgi:hypothetical protein
LCAAHLLDLGNVGELNWKWCEWEDVWNMMGRLLGRKSGGADMTHTMIRKLALIASTLDGWKVCSKCRAKKAISSFSINRARIDGYSMVCKYCDNNRRRGAKK